MKDVFGINLLIVDMAAVSHYRPLHLLFGAEILAVFIKEGRRCNGY